MAKSEIQLPLPKMSSKHVDEATKREYRIEGMGGGRYRVHRKLTPKNAK